MDLSHNRITRIEGLDSLDELKRLVRDAFAELEICGLRPQRGLTISPCARAERMDPPGSQKLADNEIERIENLSVLNSLESLHLEGK